MKNEEIIKRFFEQELGECNFKDDDNLLELGILDSFMFVELLEYIEMETGKEIDLSTIDINSFNTVKNIAKEISN